MQIVVSDWPVLGLVVYAAGIAAGAALEVVRQKRGQVYSEDAAQSHSDNFLQESAEEGVAVALAAALAAVPAAVSAEVVAE